MKTLGASVILAATLIAGASGGVQPLYQNFGTVSSPQVDATAFANYGLITYGGSLPFTTQDTLNFTNTGVLSGSVGFQFEYDTASSSGQASVFYNRGTIESVETVLTGGGGNILSGGLAYAAGFGLPFGFGGGSYLLVNASNIDNANGNLSVGPTGILSLKGSNIDLTRSGLRTGNSPVSIGLPPGFVNVGGFGGEFGFIAQQLFADPSGVTDNYAGIGTNNNFAGTGFFNSSSLKEPNVSTRQHAVYFSGSTNISRVTLGGFPGFAAFVFTNSLDSTDTLIQVVFVNTNNYAGDTNFNIDVAFAPNLNGDNPNGMMSLVRFSDWDIDAITGLPYTNSAYLMDDLATITNAIYLTNFNNTLDLKPSNFEITMVEPAEWPGAAIATPVDNATVNDLLFDSNYPSAVVTNVYSAYSANVSESSTSSSGSSSSSSQIFNILGFGVANGALSSPTNFPARVEINGGTVNVDTLRVRSVGPILFKAQSLTGGVPTRLDSQYLDIDAGTVNTPLVFTNFVPQQVRRVNGNIAAWSSVWTNYLNNVTGSGTNATTNSITIATYVTVVDQVFTTLNPGTVLGFALHATDADIQDNPVNVGTSILLDVTNLTVSGTLSINFATNIDSTVCPALQSLTIAGAFGLGNGLGLIDLGTIGNPLTNFYNAGFFSADGIQLDSQVLINSGVLSANYGPVSLTAGESRLDSGTISAGSDVNLTAIDLKAQNTTITAGSGYSDPNSGVTVNSPGALNIAVSNSLDDGGPGAANQWTVYGGFNLRVKPATNDLLGTSITTFAPNFLQVNHTWAANDLGADPSGYTNNAALGQLILDGGTSSLFVFSGVGQSNAMYVTYLGFLDGATNWQSELQINPNLIIYFADSNIPTDQLDGQLGGHLVYLPLAGFSGTSVTGGASKTGFSKIRMASVSGNKHAVITWTAAANSVYQVQTAQTVKGPWSNIFTVANNLSSPRQMEHGQPVVNGSKQAFFRVVRVK